MQESNGVFIDQLNSMVSISTQYLPGEPVTFWIKSRERKRRRGTDFDARVIAERLREYLQEVLEGGFEHRYGCMLPEEALVRIPPPRMLTSDPAGKHDAFIFVAIPAFYEDNWDGFSRLVLRAAKLIARGHKGRLLTFYACIGGPAS
jgi:hypothetical protein